MNLAVPAPGPRARPTLDEVARLAGVSRATASRVINASPRVSPEAKRLVDEAISSLGYVPNHAARSLVTRRTDTVAILISESENRLFSDPFFATMVRGIFSTIAATRVQAVLLLAADAEQRRKVERYVREGHVDGVILMSLHRQDPLPDVLHELRVPVVVSGRPPGGQHMPFVDADNYGGARLAVRHLAARGHRSIGTLAGPQDMKAGVDRLRGYRDELAALGMPYRAELVAEGDFSEASGVLGMQRILAARPGVDALFAASDPMALGAMQALSGAGLRIPEDVALVGFDNAPITSYTNPPLTTIAQPVDEMASSMATIMLRQLERGYATEDDYIVCPVQLIERQSC